MPAAVERLHHVPELADRVRLARGHRVATVGREERQRAVAPVVDDPVPGQRVDPRELRRVEVEHRQQLDRRDAEALEVRDLLDDAAIGPRVRDPGRRRRREALDVHLVDDGVRQRPAKRLIALPVVARQVDDDAAHRRLDVVPRAARRHAVPARRRASRGRTGRSAPCPGRNGGRDPPCRGGRQPGSRTRCRRRRPRPRSARRAPCGSARDRGRSPGTVAASRDARTAAAGRTWRPARTARSWCPRRSGSPPAGASGPGAPGTTDPRTPAPWTALTSSTPPPRSTGSTSGG